MSFGGCSGVVVRITILGTFCTAVIGIKEGGARRKGLSTTINQQSKINNPNESNQQTYANTSE
jgi:hypothetical protein